MKKNNYVFNDVAMRWLNKSVVTINVTLQLLDIYIYIYMVIILQKVPMESYNIL